MVLLISAYGLKVWLVYIEFIVCRQRVFFSVTEKLIDVEPISRSSKSNICPFLRTPEHVYGDLIRYRVRKKHHS